MSASAQERLTGLRYGNISYRVDDGTPVQYLLAVISKGQRSVFAFTTVLPERVESVRPKFQGVVNGITLR